MNNRLNLLDDLAQASLLLPNFLGLRLFDEWLHLAVTSALATTTTFAMEEVVAEAVDEAEGEGQQAKFWKGGAKGMLPILVPVARVTGKQLTKYSANDGKGTATCPHSRNK